MQCNCYFQFIIDRLKTSATSGVSNLLLPFLAAGNRAEANRFITYLEGELLFGASYHQVGKFPGGAPIGFEVQALFGTCSAYFSDRMASGGQPFDVHQSDSLHVSLLLPNGPLTLSTDDQTVARFSTLECKENGLLVCTSDLDRSILVLSFLPDELGLEP